MLAHRYGDEAAVAIGRAADEVVDGIGAWCATHGVDAWYAKRGYLRVNAFPGRPNDWDGTLAELARLGLADALMPLPRRRGPARLRLTGVRRRAPHAERGIGPAGTPRPRPATRAARARRPDRGGHARAAGRRSRAAPRGHRGRQRHRRARRAGHQRLGRRLAGIPHPSPRLGVGHRADRADPRPPRRAGLDRRRAAQRLALHDQLFPHHRRRAHRVRRRRGQRRLRRSHRSFVHARPSRDRARGRQPRPPAADAPRRAPDRCLGRPDRHHRRAVPEVGSARGGPAPLRPRLRRQRRRAVTARGPHPRRAGRRARGPGAPPRRSSAAASPSCRRSRCAIWVRGSSARRSSARTTRGTRDAVRHSSSARSPACRASSATSSATDAGRRAQRL